MNETDQAPPRHYDQWLSYVFDRAHTGQGFSLDTPPFGVNHAEIVELITYTMLNSGHDLLGFSDGQVSLGLDIIFNNSFSDYAFSIRERTLPTMPRLRAIDSIKRLYSDCFEPRCAPVLHNERGTNSLNHVCFMLWDVTPVSYWEGYANKQLFYSKVLEVLEFALESRNQA